MINLALSYATSLLQVPDVSLSNALLFRVINTGTGGGRRSTYNVPQNVEQVLLLFFLLFFEITFKKIYIYLLY